MILRRCLLFYCAFTIGGVIVAVLALATLIMVCAVMMVANYTRTIHNRVLIVDFL